MSDDKTNRGPRDADRVNINEDYEVRYWTQKWGITEAQLKEAVRRAGVMARDVAKALGRN